MSRPALKPSDKLALGAIAGGIAAILLIDWLFGTILGFWPSLVIGLVTAVGWYKAGLQFGAEKAIIDRLGK